ncbi:MAG: DUF2252 family protein [Gemmatimonadota bacterium]
MPSRSVFEQVLRYNAGRDPERLARKLIAMRRHPFAFFRGTAHLFYADQQLLQPLGDAPPIWSCGDLHLENFGCYKGDNRLAYFDLNDFDDAALGPLTWDLVRLLTSLRLGLRAEAGNPRLLSEFLLGEYAAILEGGKPRWIERATAEGAVLELLRRAKLRRRRALLTERTEWSPERNRHRLRLLPERTLAASAAEHRQVGAVIARLRLPGVEPRFFRVLDVARRVAGIASLGLTRYVVLVEGRGSPSNNYLLDVKGAIPSTLAESSPSKQPHWRDEAERIVVVQQWMQAVSPALLTATRLGGTACVVRELQPTADRLTLAAWRSRPRGMERLLRTVAQVTAWDHLRAAGRRGAASADELMRFGKQRGWKAAVLRVAERAAVQVEANWQSFVAALPAESKTRSRKRTSNRKAER